MELFEYVPGAMATAWMVFRIGILVVKGQPAPAPAERHKPALRLV
jgi:hypothetical protein